VTGAIANRFTPSYSSRNYVINGGLDFNQRFGFSAAMTGTPTYTADRWYQELSDAGGTTVYAGGGPSGYNYATVVIATALTTATIKLSQSLETANVKQLAGKFVTFSFYVKANNYAPTVTASIIWGTGTDQLSPTGGGTFTSNSLSYGAAAWSRVSFTAFIPSTATSLRVQIQLRSDGNANNAVNISNLMLNEGPVAAPFERAGGTIGGELALCQRYYERFGFSGNYETMISGVATAASQVFYGTLWFKATKRVRSLTTGVSGTFAALNCGQPTITDHTDKAAVIQVTSAAAGPVQSVNNVPTAGYTFDAEL
jgi:hypothetical protein